MGMQAEQSQDMWIKIGNIWMIADAGLCEDRLLQVYGLGWGLLWIYNPLGKKQVSLS